MNIKILSWFKPSDHHEYLHIDLGQHQYGNFSMATVKGNAIVEDQSQIESGPIGLKEEGPFGTFVEVYDGHAGPDASIFTREKLFGILQGHIINKGRMSTEVLIDSIAELENQYLGLVRENLPGMLLQETSCVVGMVSGGQIYIANVGDSRAVMGTVVRTKSQVKAAFERKGIQAVPLTINHSMKLNSGVQDFNTRQLKYVHTDDYLRAKAYIRTSRTIGAAFLKMKEFNNCSGLSDTLRFKDNIRFPILSHVPWTKAEVLNADNKFVIFGSHGFWDLVDEQRVVEIVYNSSQKGIARVLIKHALKKVALDQGLTYRKLEKLEAGSSLSFYDDISVVVLFLDHHKINSNRVSPECPRVAVRTYGASRFLPTADGASTSGSKSTKEAGGSIWQHVRGIGSSFRS